MMKIADYIRNIPELAEASAEIDAELNKGIEKTNATRELYATAHDIVMGVMSEVPATVADIFAKCESELPEGFTKAKVQYALLNYWKDEVVKVDNGKRSPMTYRKAWAFPSFSTSLSSLRGGFFYLQKGKTFQLAGPQNPQKVKSFILLKNLTFLLRYVTI